MISRIEEQSHPMEEPKAIPPQLSVVIPSYNMAPHIGRCLASLMAQATSAAFEVIVVDSSNDGTDRLVRERFPDGLCIHLPRRTNAAMARNIGIRRARAPIVAFLDADCIADPHWVDAILKAHAGPFEVVSGAISPATPHTLAGLMLFAIEFSQFMPRNRARPVTFAPSCNLSAKLEALIAVGLFPEEFDHSHDTVMCWRYRQLRRGPILFEPEIRVHHISRGRMGEALRHLTTHGRYSAKARRACPMQGSFLLERPALIPLLVPLRYGRILGRLAQSSRDRWPAALCIACTPLILLGLAVWARGFMQGAKQ
jgi:GT2 family glycosyltransferase